MLKLRNGKEIQYILSREDLEYIRNLLYDGLSTDGGRHKQWFLEEIAKKLGFDIGKNYEEGIAP